MTATDTDALLDRLRRNAQAPMDRFDRLHGMGGFPEYGEDERPFPDEVLKLLDLLAAAEHRATRAEAQSAVRGRAVVIYRERAREAEAERDQAYEWADDRSYPLVMRQGEILTGVANALNGPTPPRTSWSHHDLAEKAAAMVTRAEQAEARVRDLAQEAKDERGACLDQMEQVRSRDARIGHLEDTARVLVKEVLKAEAERDSARGYISELETAMESRNDVIKHRDARIKAWEKQYDHDLAQADLIADQAEAIIRRQERYIEGLESTDAVGLKARAETAEARIKAVQDVLSKHESILGDNLGVPVEHIRRALDGE